MTADRPTDEQLRQWLYDAEYDWDVKGFDRPMPSNTFPVYYDDAYQETLAALFRELLEHRRKARRDHLVEEAVNNPDPSIAGRAAVELQKLTREGDSGPTG
ncbi:hypothetical protein [Nocardia sp. NBC_01009]|uniref:hypothetical protein n=1 Tax=Nocardia sp. NBC_01009 TaxID=2975996 RepID=UPI00386E51F6|nr:hypothetical protein OHA42_23145 [Nocardia sp. NBC_01009]